MAMIGWWKSLTLASHCMTASWPTAATQMTAGTTSVPSEDAPPVTTLPLYQALRPATQMTAGTPSVPPEDARPATTIPLYQALRPAQSMLSSTLWAFSHGLFNHLK